MAKVQLVQKGLKPAHILFNNDNLGLFSQAAAAELKKKRTFRKFTYRGVDLDQLLDMNNEQLMELFPCRIRSVSAAGHSRRRSWIRRDSENRTSALRLLQTTLPHEI